MLSSGVSDPECSAVSRIRMQETFRFMWHALNVKSRRVDPLTSGSMPAHAVGARPTPVTERSRNMSLAKLTRSRVAYARAFGLAIVATALFVRMAAISGVEAQTKSASQQSLDKIVQSLKALDTAYASGNTAEAQSDFENANNQWKSLSSKISAREGREVQLLFDSLQTKLNDKAPAKEVSKVVRGTLEELQEDIRRELNGKKGEREEGEEK